MKQPQGSNRKSPTAWAMQDTQEALLHIGVALTSGLQMENVLRAILDECRKVLPVDALYVALYDADAQCYSVPLFWDQGVYRSLGTTGLHEQPSLTQVVIERGQTLYLADLHEPETAAAYPSIKVADAPTRTYLGVPLLMRGQVTGVLSVQNLRTNAYDANAIRLMELIATQAAVAVENARLFEDAQRDIRERKRQEEALEQRVRERTAALRTAVAELERANAGKDAFMAAVSHELRTPLTGILGISEVLESQIRGPLNEHQMRYVQTIHGSGVRLLEMITSVLDYTSAMAESTPQATGPCRVAELCAAASHAVQPKAQRKHLAVEVDVEPADLVLYTDGNALQQVMRALLDNAVKFTPAGKRVGIAVTLAEAEVTAQPSEAVQITVWDEGIGIKPEQRHDLFEPFTQVDKRLARQYDGLGLGLAFVRQRVELLGGRIEVESIPEQGSRFVVKLDNTKNTY